MSHLIPKTPEKAANSTAAHPLRMNWIPDAENHLSPTELVVVVIAIPVVA